MTIEELPVLANIHSIAELRAATNATLQKFGYDPSKIDLTSFADAGLDNVLEMWLADQSIRLDHLRYIESGGTVGRWVPEYGEPNPLE